MRVGVTISISDCTAHYHCDVSIVLTVQAAALTIQYNCYTQCCTSMYSEIAASPILLLLSYNCCLSGAAHSAYRCLGYTVYSMLLLCIVGSPLVQTLTLLPWYMSSITYHAIAHVQSGDNARHYCKKGTVTAVHTSSSSSSSSSNKSSTAVASVRMDTGDVLQNVLQVSALWHFTDTTLHFWNDTNFAINTSCRDYERCIDCCSAATLNL
jgi:hypothetical protein